MEQEYLQQGVPSKGVLDRSVAHGRRGPTSGSVLAMCGVVGLVMENLELRTWWKSGAEAWGRMCMGDGLITI